jgi:alpha-D-ribose 1-methylphosphonate 5-triphosphate diphosphatase
MMSAPNIQTTAVYSFSNDAGRNFAIQGARIVLPNGTIESGQIEVFDGTIQSVSDLQTTNLPIIRAEGCTILPGIIDLHSDALEKYIQPRRGSLLPEAIAIYEFDKTLAACGITTMFHCIALMDSEWVGRSLTKAVETLEKLVTLGDHLLVHSKIHVRYDLPSPEALPILMEKIDAGHVDLVSLMDHTPGQGQYRDLEKVIQHRKNGQDEATARKMVEDRIAAAQGKIRQEDIQRLSDHCNQHGITIASHDDESIEKVHFGYKLGARANEFPVTLEAAEEARKLGQPICLGAPNALRGLSHSGNVSARDAIQRNLCDVLCSDYAPLSLVHSIFLLEGIGLLSLPQATNLVSLNPAKAVGLDEKTGSIEVGKTADMIIVDHQAEVPRVVTTFVSGRPAYHSVLP